MKKHLLFLLLILPLTSNATTYYVKSSGTDPSDCSGGKTHATAWKSLSKVNSCVKKVGADVYFLAGDSWNGQLIVDWSGESLSNYAIIGSYYLKNGSVAIGVPSGTKKPTFIGGYNLSRPARGNMPVSEDAGLIDIKANYVRISNMRVEKSSGIGIKLQRDFHHALIEKSEVYISAAGSILFSWGTHNNIMRNNDVSRCEQAWYDGLASHWQVCNGAIGSRYNIIEKNYVHESWGEGIVAYGAGANNNIIRDNVIAAVRSGNIYIDNGQNNIVERNIIVGDPTGKFHRQDGYTANALAVSVEDYPITTNAIGNIFRNNVIANSHTCIRMGMEPGARANNRKVGAKFIGNTCVGVHWFVRINVPNANLQEALLKNNIFYDPDTLNSDTEFSCLSTATNVNANHNFWESEEDIKPECRGYNDRYGNPYLKKSSGWRNTGPNNIPSITDFEPDTSTHSDIATPIRTGVATRSTAFTSNQFPQTNKLTDPKLDLTENSFDIHKVLKDGENPDIGALEPHFNDGHLDSDPPTRPTNLKTTGITYNQIDLSWSPSSDVGGGKVMGYKIYRNGNTSTHANIPVGTHFADVGLSQNSTYTYRVIAYDNAVPANESSLSSSIQVTTPSKASNSNLLVDPGFEDSNLKFWSGSGSVNSDHVLTGTYALAFKGSTSSYPTAFQKVTNSFVAGSNYHFGAWIKVVGISTGKYIFQIRWYDSSGSEITSARKKFGDTSRDTDYVYKSINITAPVNASAVRFQIQGNSANGMAYIDNAGITKGYKPSSDTSTPTAPDTGSGSGSGSASSSNLISNADFEGGNLNGWSGSGKINSAFSYNGTYALALTGKSTGYVSAYQHVKDKIIAGKEYSFSAWLSTRNMSTGKYLLQIRWYDTSGAQIGATKSFGAVTGNTSYSKKSISVVAPSYATSARLQLQASKANGIAYIDDVSISNGSTTGSTGSGGSTGDSTSGSNLLSNSSFESGNLNGWSGSGKINSAYSYNGTYALALAGKSTGYISAYQHVKDKVIAGKPYIFSAWLRTRNMSTGKYLLQIRWYNASGAQIGAVKGFGAVTGNTSYSKKSVTVTAPTNATSVRLQLQASKVNGIAYIDDVKILKK